MNSPLLSICIPTYSRAEKLRRCLDSITVQFADPEVISQMEIVVSDNASADNTEDLIKNYQLKYPQIRYARNAANLGFDRNVDAVLKLGRGQFLWLMGDDEILAERSLAFLLPLLKTHPDAAYFCVNHGGLKRRGNWELFANGSEWLNNLGLTGGLISQNIYNSKFLPSGRDKYYGNLWMHFSLAFEIMAKRPALLVKSLFKKSQEDDFCRWAVNGFNFTTYFYLYKIVRSLPNLGYEKPAVNKVTLLLAKGLPRNIASARMRGLKISLDKAREIVCGFRAYPWWVFLSLIVFFTPAPLIKILKSLLTNLKLLN